MKIHYSTIVRTIAERTGQPMKVVKEVMEVFTEIVENLRVDEKAASPLGTFQAHYRSPRPIKLPGGEPSKVKAQVFVRLKINQRLRTNPGDKRWSYLTTPPPNLPRNND
jgi:nucleoid DNA-binding protein